ncbi:MAG: hypothetical protein LBC74_15800, partial [Planctomycetaceae bacterium]|nr:hypothetical protein [Planctomycetaceae bacterium]
MWLSKSNGETLTTRAVNSMEDDSLWPVDPNQKPVWSNAVITNSTEPWKAGTDHSTLTAGIKTVVSAECGNTKPVDILVVDLDELTVTEDSDATNKKTAKPNNHTLYVVQGTNDEVVINTSLKYLVPTAPNGVPACPNFKWSILGETDTFSTSNNPSDLIITWSASHNREFTIKTWLDGVTETDDTVRKVDVVVAKIETELQKKWNSTWGAVTNKTGTYSANSTNAGKTWYVLWDCHENRIKPAILPTTLIANVSSVSWNGISTTAGTNLWHNITDTSGSFTDIIPTLTLNNGVTLKGKIKTDIAVTGVQKVEWISNATASTKNLAIIKESGQQEIKSFNVAKVESDVIADRKKIYPEKSKPSDTQPFNVAELKATLTQQIPGSMNASLYFYVTDNTNDRPGDSTDIVITGGTNNGTTTREPEAANFNTMYGSKVGRTYVKFNTPAHAGDDYIGVAHPESGLTVIVTSSPSNPKAQVGTTILPDEYQSKLLTVWRTLWIERDRMLAPNPQTNSSLPNPHGFA